MKNALFLFLLLAVSVSAQRGGRSAYRKREHLVSKSDSVEVFTILGGKSHTPVPSPEPSPSPSPSKSPSPSPSPPPKSPSPSPSKSPSPSPRPKSPSPSPSTSPSPRPSRSVVPSPSPTPSPPRPSRSVVPSPSPSPSTPPSRSVIPSPSPTPSPPPRRLPSPSTSPEQSPVPSPDLEFPADYSTTESTVRTSILRRDIAGAAEEIASSRLFGIRKGLTYTPEMKKYFVNSEDRNDHPDVIAMKALAKAALDTGDAYTLSTAVLLSFQANCECPAYSSDKEDNIREALAEDFMDEKEMKKILYADANQEKSSGKTGRGLKAAHASPVGGLICAQCWPNRTCKYFHWC